MLMPPCGKVCPDREPGCHSKCEKYAEYRAKMNEIDNARFKDKLYGKVAENGMYRRMNKCSKF